MDPNTGCGGGSNGGNCGSNPNTGWESGGGDDGGGDGGSGNGGGGNGGGDGDGGDGNGNGKKPKNTAGGVFKGAGHEIGDELMGPVNIVKSWYDCTAHYWSFMCFQPGGPQTLAFFDDPRGTLSGMWNGLIGPVRDDWKSGQKDEAAGRVLIMFAEAVVGGKGVSKLSKVVTGRSAAETAAREGAEAEAAAGCNSFAPGTAVLMADGSTKPIDKIVVGDQVLATDPVTGETSGEPVSALIVELDNVLTDVTIKDQQGRKSTIHTTPQHPFWASSASRWIYATDLHPGDKLFSPGGRTVQVVRTQNAIGYRHMHNLTVSAIHTYYVLAGSTPVLVHNAGCGPTYENPGHHDPTGGPNPYNPRKAVLPSDALEQFANSVQVGDTRWSKIGSGKKAVYYRYFQHGDDVWHWSGSSNGVTNGGTSVPIPMDDIPIQVRRMRQ